MKTFLRFALPFLTLAALAWTPTAQKTGGSGNNKPGEGGTIDPTGGGAGGSYGGPGDTTPGGGPTGSGGANPTGGLPVPRPGGPPPPNPYANGANPLAPQFPLGVIPMTAFDPARPVTPTSRPSVENPDSWQYWWHYNRWAYLDGGNQLSITGTGGFYLGRGEKAQTNPLLRASRGQMQDLVQPALIEALLRGGRPEVEIFNLHALAKLRGIAPDERLGGFADVVPRFLRSGNQNVAEKAVLALGIHGDDRFLPWLTGILGDTPYGREVVGQDGIGYRMRTFAAYGLGLLGERTQDPEVLVAIHEALTHALWIERDEVQAACVQALGHSAMPVDSEYPERGELFKGRTRFDQVLELISFFEDPEQSFEARSQTPNAIARLLPGARETLRERAAHAFLVACGPHTREQTEVQDAAVIALGQIGRSGGEAIDAVVRDQLERIAYRSSGDRNTRYFAMIALAQAASRPGEGDDPYVGLEPARKEFLRNLGRSRGETQAWTALALGVLESTADRRGELPLPMSGKALRQTFERTRSHEVAGALAIALGMCRDVEAEELLRQRMLETGEANSRSYCALALGMLRSPSAIEDVRRVLTASTHQPFVVENAAISLALLGDQEVGSTLFSILEKASNPKVQSSVASAVGWIKDPRPLPQLCEQLLDTRKNDTGRAWTAVAIGRICDDDTWPWVARASVDVQYYVWLPTLIEPAFETGLLDLP